MRVEQRRTRWRSKVNSNSRYRFLNKPTTAGCLKTITKGCRHEVSETGLGVRIHLAPANSHCELGPDDNCNFDSLLASGAHMIMCSSASIWKMCVTAAFQASGPMPTSLRNGY